MSKKHCTGTIYVVDGKSWKKKSSKFGSRLSKKGKMFIIYN